MATVKKASKPSSSTTRNVEPRLFGSHLSIAGGVSNALRDAVRLKMNTLQIFVKNQRQWRAPPLKPDDVADWQELRDKHGVNAVIAHATYLINLASADPELHEKSRRAYAEELQRCDALDVPYLVVHPGAAGEQSVPAALERVAAAINRIFKDQPEIKAMPLLETTAGQGTSLGRSFEELGQIVNLLHEPQRVGVCVDTCHVFAAGYDIRDPDAYAAMIEEAQKTVGLERIRCWHLNDCKGECGGRLDRHAHIGLGNIGLAGFRNVLQDPRFARVPMILETPKGEDDRGREWDRINLQKLRRLASAPTPQKRTARKKGS